MASDLDMTSMRTTLELQLRRDGLRLVAQESGEKVDATLTFHTSTMHYRGDTFFPLYAECIVRRRVYLHPSANSPSTIGIAWDQSELTSNSWPDLKKSLERATDAFVNEWLAVNPRLAVR